MKQNPCGMQGTGERGREFGDFTPSAGSNGARLGLHIPGALLITKG